MDAQQFLADFSHIASAPNGVNQLRQLVMGLALAGNLLANNETLSEDFALQIEAARHKYFSVLGRRTHPFLFSDSLIKEFRIPDGWKWVRVGEVCDLQTGATPSTQHPEYFGGDIRWLVSGDVNRGEIYDCEGRITDEGLKNSNCKILPQNSVLIALNGQGKTRATVAILRIPAACNQSLVAIIPFSQDILYPEYLYLSLKYRYYEIRDITGQKQRRGLNMGLVSELSIPLAPIEEQKRIVAKVDELMALCDKLEAQWEQHKALRKLTCTATLNALSNAESTDDLRAAWERLESNMRLLLDEPEDVEQIKIAILELAVHGKLNLRESSVTEATVERMRARKRDLANKKIIKRETTVVDFPGVQELLKPIPETWVWCRLNDIASVVRGGSPRPAGDPRFYGGDIPFLKVADVTRSRGMFVEGFTATIKKEGLKKTREITERTVLLTNSGATLGVPRICTFRTTFNDGIAAFIELADEVFDEYLYFYLEAKSKWLLDIASRGQGQPNLNTDIIRSIWFPLPPMIEQRAIVEKVKSLFSICDKLADQQEETQTVAAAFASACTSAINGIRIEDKEKMKTPKTELVSNLRIGVSPTNREQAPLTAILVRHQGELSAKALWGSSGLEVDAFYQQLKTEMANGWIVQPEAAYVRELETA